MTLVTPTWMVLLAKGFGVEAGEYQLVTRAAPGLHCVGVMSRKYIAKGL